MKIDLTEGEKRFIAPIEKHFSERAQFTITLDTLLNDWDNLCDELQDKYHLGWEDYLNDLDGRHLLQEIVDSSPAALARKINSLLNPIDDNFKAVTMEDRWNLVPIGFKQKGGWWYTRIPREWAKSN